MVLDLENTKTTQALEINSLKRRVKKLKKKQRSRTHKLKRLYKVGLIARMDSFDEASLGEDASKQERIINDIDADEGITLVGENAENQGRLQAEEQKELTDKEKARLFVQFLEKRRKFFAAKRAVEKRNIPPIRAQKRSIMCIYLKNMEGWKLKSLKNKSFANIQELFDKAMERVNTFIDYMTDLIVESLKEAKEKVMEAEGNSQMYLTFSKMLKIFDREDLEVLWRLVKARFEKIKPMDYMDNLLFHNLKTMFEHHVKDNSIPFYLLVEKMYPLANYTLHQMFNNVKLQVDYECEMAFKILRLIKK
nr:hypothetical protein [Tanacetum cinerariifolium]